MVKNPPANAGDGFNSWAGKIPWRRNWQPIPVFLPGRILWTEEPGGLRAIGPQRSQVDYGDLARRSFERATVGTRRGRASVSCRCVWEQVGDGTWGLQEAEAGGAVRRRSPAVGWAREMLRGGWTMPPAGAPGPGLAGQMPAEPFTEQETQTVTGERLGSPELTRLLHQLPDLGSWAALGFVEPLVKRAYKSSASPGGTRIKRLLRRAL